jgi:ketol-acid reductoisomerase
MRELAAHIASGEFADEWDEESRRGYPQLEKLKQEHAGPAIRQLEDDLRKQLGPALK